MADVWGGSWGDSWGDSWAEAVEATSPIPDKRHTVYVVDEDREVFVSRENRTLIGMNQ